MIDRKKKLRLRQLSLLTLGLLFLLFTYLGTGKKSEEKIISLESQKKIKNQLSNDDSGDIFFNIEYSGLDLAGNRYILKSKEAYTEKLNPDVVNMKLVTAYFYFKDDTILYVESEEGIYNNKTLDMNFNLNVKAKYEDSELFSQKAEYLNSKGFLIVSDNVKVKDIRGTMFADKLLFDIKKQTLNISSLEDEKINANLNYK